MWFPQYSIGSDGGDGRGVHLQISWLSQIFIMLHRHPDDCYHHHHPDDQVCLRCVPDSNDCRPLTRLEHSSAKTFHPILISTMMVMTTA